MSTFYTNVFQRGDRIYYRGYDLGLRVKNIDYYKPYMFLHSPTPSEYKTLDGRFVKKIEFDGIKDAKEFIKNYEDVDNFEIFGLTNFTYTYIYDKFKKDIDYDPKIIRVGMIDIEVAADEGFPSIERADKPITAISIRYKKRNYVFGCRPFKTDDPKTFYMECSDEVELLQQFLQCWETMDLDIVSGWNIEMFDIPYIYNRICNLLGEASAKRLSPWKIVDRREIIRGKSTSNSGKDIESRIDVIYDIAGISSLDYLQLYKKFSFSNQESYKLDYIAQVELGEKKVDYSDYGSLLELYKKNFQKFIEYNIHDSILVERLDDKLKLIEQVMALAYDAKVNYNDTMTTVRPWDVIIHNYLMSENTVIPMQKRNRMTQSLVGGYVKEPKLGLSKWVVSFDLNSLYPHLIMQYNISPETFSGRLGSFPSIDRLIEGESAPDDGFSYTANGCKYVKDRQGFLPKLMEMMYEDRSNYKKLMIEAKKRYEQTKSSEDEKLIARYHNMQMAKKIQLNSAYGALGNEYFRWFSFNNAEAITTSGQLSIRWIERKINEFMNKILKTKDVDYVIASDTDSIYVTMESMVDKAFGDTEDAKNEVKIVKAIDKFCEEKIQPNLDKWYQQLADKMNAYSQKMKMKRETIANKGIWKAKKMYILNAWNVEGVQYDQPKLKMQGIEAVRSSTPYACRENIKKALGIIMNEEETVLQKFISDFKSEFTQMPFESVAFPRGVKNMAKYSDASSIYIKGTPIHVKGALIFNDLIKKHGLKNIQPITDGDKIKFAYLKVPNPTYGTVIATPDVLPKEFNLDKYIDRDTQFEKTFLEPIKSITDVIGWRTEKINTIEDFFE